MKILTVVRAVAEVAGVDLLLGALDGVLSHNRGHSQGEHQLKYKAYDITKRKETFQNMGN